MSLLENEQPVILIGAGGHARVLVDVLQRRGRRILFATDLDSSIHGQEIAGVRVAGGDERVLDHVPEEVVLVNGIGSTSAPDARRCVYERFRAKGYRFATVLHPTAVIAESARLDEGVQVMAGAVIQPGVTLGPNVLVNTSASVDHDCVVAPHAHLAPGVVLSGGVHVGDCAHLGTGAVVIQGIEIGASAVVGAGSVVIRDVPRGVTVVGSPARSIHATTARTQDVES